MATLVPVSRFIGAIGRSALAASLLTISCATPAPAPSNAPPPPPPPPPAEHVPPPVQEEPEAPEVKILSDIGLQTPESVYYDKKRDVYLVSNINGSPHDKDGNGFISKITPDGEVTAKFIEGTPDKITLHAPKGLTVAGDVLYVADIDHVRMFDAQTGAPLGEIEIQGASLLNDLATGKPTVIDGKETAVIYVSDTGVDAAWKPDGKDAIYTIIDGKAKKLIADKKLGNPNGLLASAGGVWVVNGQAGELYWVSDKGKQEPPKKISGGSNDGIVLTEDGRVLISSWADSAVYSGSLGGEFQKEISGVEAPADIGFDCRRNRVLIPLFKKNQIIVHTLNEKPASSTK